jgi:hypothetical protein
MPGFWSLSVYVLFRKVKQKFNKAEILKIYIIL